MSEPVAATPTLAQLEEAGARAYDPLRFDYLERLSERLYQRENGPSSHHEARFHQALASFNQAFEQARENARKALRQSRSGPQAEALFAAGDFKALERLLRDRAPGPGQTLAQLNEYLAHQQPPQPGPEDELEAMLQRQWSRLPQPTRRKRTTPPLTPPPLRALSQLQASQARRHTQQRIHDALAQPLHDAGPLNAQRLVTGALQRMQDISPAYLHRLVSYLDVLMALEKRGTRS